MLKCCASGRKEKFSFLEDKLTQLCLQLAFLEYCFVVTETGIILTPSSRIKPVKEVDSPLVFQIKQLATHLTTLVFRSRCRTIRLTTSQSEIAIYDVGDQLLVAFFKKSKGEKEQQVGLSQEKLEELARLIQDTLWSE
ncbi:hypothetical protein GAYE_SCF09G3183 [Galdieria yellowstonensis]|uniref:FUZ/MON1/HPS1 first Longin domain-containing protein n=1 Tax=Galdieria yellowstonensis TaxID=3028027 RepID=A0AAV9ID28_9RHOD|nr:hypothetical protein GAYE_SCF09G3183 [Galdieria yellowstonensis]